MWVGMPRPGHGGATRGRVPRSASHHPHQLCLGDLPGWNLSPRHLPGETARGVPRAGAGRQPAGPIAPAPSLRGRLGQNPGDNREKGLHSPQLGGRVEAPQGRGRAASWGLRRAVEIKIKPQFLPPEFVVGAQRHPNHRQREPSARHPEGAGSGAARARACRGEGLGRPWTDW